MRQRSKEKGKALGCQTGRNPEEIGFGNAALNESVGVFLLEENGPGRGVEIGVQHEQALVGPAEFYKRFSEDFAQCLGGVGKFHGWQVQAGLRSALTTSSRPASFGEESGRENRPFLS